MADLIITIAQRLKQTWQYEMKISPPVLFLLFLGRYKPVGLVPLLIPNLLKGQKPIGALGKQTFL